MGQESDAARLVAVDPWEVGLSPCLDDARLLTSTEPAQVTAVATALRARLRERRGLTVADLAPPPGFVIQEIAAGRSDMTMAALLGPYLSGASKVELVDPYLQRPHQHENLDALLRLLPDGATIHVTTWHGGQSPQDRGNEAGIRTALTAIGGRHAQRGIRLSINFQSDVHDRSLTTPTHLISLGRGLDMWEVPRPGLPRRTRRCMVIVLPR
jgi:hypothetical protein